MAEYGVTTKPLIVQYQDASQRSHEFVNLRVHTDLADWLRDITKLASRGHEARCLCPACRARRELEL